MRRYEVEEAAPGGAHGVSDGGLAEVDDDVLEHRLRTGAAALAAATCEWLTILAEFVERRTWAVDGARSPASWLSWALGIGPSTAREHVRVALRLRELPATRARFAAGRLSYSKVRAISRVADDTTEAMLLRWADAATAAELERIVRDTETIVRSESSAPSRDDLGASGRWRADGSYELRLRVDAATGVVVEQHLDRLVELVTAAGRDEGDADHRPTRRDAAGDAVVGALAAAVAAGPNDTSGADRHLAVVEVSPLLLEAASASAEAEPSPRVGVAGVGRGRGRTRPVPLLQLRRLLCASRVDLTTRSGLGVPADLGTARRFPDARLRRLLLARDRTCRFPGCGAVRFLHAHHVVAWSDGGPTDLDNLVLLCGHHHRFVHGEGWVLRPVRLGVWSFHAPDRAGSPAPPHPRAGRLRGASAGALHLALAAHADRADPAALAPVDRDGFGYDHDIAVGVLLDRVLAGAGAGAGASAS